MSSIFTKIIQGEIPCHKIAESEDFFAFLDIRPLSPGHTLVVPKKEIDYLFDLDDHLLQSILSFSKNVAKGLEATVPCERIGVSVVGLEVPHAHVHLIPIKKVADMSFTREPISMSQEELADLAERIRANL